MSRAAVLAGRRFSDILLNCLSLVVLFTVWCAVLIAVFAPLAVTRHRRVSAS